MNSQKWMLPVAVVSILLIVVLAWYSRPPQPASPSQNLVCPATTVQENFDRADVVMTGTVDIVLPGQPYVSVMVAPGKVYKGQPNGAVKILANEASSSNTAATGSRDINFASDQPPYLLFLRQGDDGYLTSRCDGSRLLGSGLTEQERELLEKNTVVSQT